MEGQSTALRTVSARVSRVRELTGRIKSFELHGLHEPLPAFTAGSHVVITTGSGLGRSYSLANNPVEPDRYLIAVLREESGRGSSWMHDHVREGDVLQLSEPRNAFLLEEEADRHLLLAGGIGITPILSMAHRLAAIGAKFQVVYCARSAQEAAFATEFQAAFGDRARMHYDNGEAHNQLDLGKLLRDQPAGTHLYVCGPSGFIQAVRTAAGTWPRNAVHFELFSSAPAVVPQEPTTADGAGGGDLPFEVELASSGQVFTIPADRTILDVLLEAGLKMPYVCKEGWCGNCQLGLLGGCADHRDEVLSEEEKAANTSIHICISRALAGERLVLDR